MQRLGITVCAGLVYALSAMASFPASYNYAELFQRFSPRFLPGWDHRWLVAQCYQESNLVASAVSPVGARGVCQFMPQTWAECQKALKFKASPHHPTANIRCAAWYMDRMRRIWKAPRPEHERRKLAQASYNAGAGHIIKAQRHCNDASHWQAIAPCLPQVTGHHAKETTTYVQRIQHWYQQLVH